MASIKSLVKDTAIYGTSSIVGRFLNWGLTPLYAYLFLPDEFGIQSYLYSFTAVALIILTYGMETGFFRFANKEGADPARVYSTSLISVGTTSLLFIILLSVFVTPLSKALLVPQHPSYVWLLGVVVGVDAFCNIPFAYLRYSKRPWMFATIKLFNIGVTILLNLFFLLLCPAIVGSDVSWFIDWFYLPLGGKSFGIGWIFVANFISTLLVLLALTPFFAGRIRSFDFVLLRRMLSYSWPLLVLGVAGILSQNMGQILIPYLFDGNEEAARSMVGIFGANMKIAIVMVMFAQAFRYAYEPYIFSQARQNGEDKSQAYCDAMKFFVIFALVIFLGVMFFLPILKYFISFEYWDGLKVIPVMMVAEIFAGIFFNLSLWYKLTDRTLWGMYFSLICFALMLGLNLWFMPAIGIPNAYMGAAWSAVISYFVVMCLSYFIGRRYYPLPYPLLLMGKYTAVAILLYVIGEWMFFPTAMWLTFVSRAILLIGFILAIYLGEFAGKIKKTGKV